MNKQNLTSLTVRIFILFSIVLLAACAMDKGEAEEVDRWLVPKIIREAVLNEFSGELALRHVEILSGDRNYPGVSPTQIGWGSIRPGEDENGFGFTLTKQQHDEIRSYLERDTKVVMSTRIRTQMLPYKMNVVSAAIPGTDPEAGELLLVAHLFERIATPGANDNCSGVATILEVGRTLTKLISEGILEAPRRTIRFLWVPEISGTREFMYKYPELQHKLIAALNFDMVGADYKTTDAFLRMKKTPDSCPSYLNDLMANGDKWMGEVSRQSVILLQNNVEKIHSGYQAARNKIEGAFLRGKGNILSVTDISNDGEVGVLLTQLVTSLESSRENHEARLSNLYRLRLYLP